MTDKCIICLDELHCNIGAITPCGHAFHRDCFNAMKRSKESSNDSSSDDSSGKLPRCPVCKHKSKKFIDIYLTFEARDPMSTHGNRLEGVEGFSSSSSYDEATQALASLTSENMRLRKSLQEVKSVSKGQGELLLDVLPKIDDLQSKLKRTSKEKEMLEEENSELLTGWNDIEMKMQMVKIEKEELEEKLRDTKRSNEALHQKWDDLEVKLMKAKKKRKLLESKQADELKDVKFQISKSKLEKEEMFGLLKKAQMKASSLKRMVKKLKRKQSRDQNRSSRMKIFH